MLRIDGSQGEGGGQILRTALTLAALLRTPIEVLNIRAGRRNPGLQPQHLTAVTAVARVTGAEVAGATPGSPAVTFIPGPTRAGDYAFDVGTAGSVTLILQALLLPLALAGTPSRLRVRGGTHVPWSPSVHYLDAVFLPPVRRIGLEAKVSLLAWGFYPRGGGEVEAVIQGTAGLAPLSLLDRGGIERVGGVSAVANLPRRIAERQRDRAARRLGDAGFAPTIELVEAAGPGQGTVLFLAAEYAGVVAGFTALGERGKPAERVADEVVEALLDFHGRAGAVDAHLADQLVLPLVLARGSSTFTTVAISRHLLTNAQVVNWFLPGAVTVEGAMGEAGRVTVQGQGAAA